MNPIADILFAFVLLGFTEVVAKPLAKWWFERRLRRLLPSVFAALDPIMPSLIANYQSGQLENAVRNQLNDITGEDWSSQNIDLFFQLYDPRCNADHLN